MGIKDKSKKAAAGASVAIATASLGSCSRPTHGDPPPPPLECNTVDEGESLRATATVTGRELRVMIRNVSYSEWTAAEVTSVVGGSARPISLGPPFTVVIDLEDDTVKSGSFTLKGTLRGYPDKTCAVSRTFVFTLGPDGVVVAFAPELPLSARQQARIALVARDGLDVDLEATTPFRGARTITWTVTAGEVVSREGPRLRWRLPAQAGLYQAELVIDYGPHGLSFDTLALEVS